MPPQSVPRPRFRPARQARSQRTLDRLLTAARELARAGGLEAVTVQEVTRRSGVTTGSFYARFAGRDALLHHMENRFWEDVEERWRRFLEPERWRALEPVAAVALFVRTTVRSYRRAAPELRAYLLHALVHPERKPLRRVVALEEGVASRMAELLRPRFGQMGHRDPGLATEFATRDLLASLRSDVLLWNAGNSPAGSSAASAPAPVSTERLTEERRILERTRAFAAYLGLNGAPTTEEELAEVAMRARRKNRGS